MFFVALALLLMMFSAYIYFVSASIVHVIARKEVDREIAHVHSRIAELESTYIAVNQSISEEMATEHGFTAESATKKVFVQKQPTNLVLVVHDES